MQSPTRQLILEIFERHRATPGAPFEESHFLDFLLAAPKSAGAVLKNFQGLRRLNRFIKDVQYEFAVFFSPLDRETSYSVDTLIERITRLQASTDRSLRSLRNQQRASTGWGVAVIANLMLLFLVSSNHYRLWIAAPAILISFAITATFFVSARNSAAYLRRLRIRIESAGGVDA
jgi:hypothetical protein